MRPILKDHLERSLLGGTVFLGHRLRNLRHVEVDDGIGLLDLAGVRLDGPEDSAGFVRSAVGDELVDLLD